MQSGKIITLSVYLMILFNLLLAFGSIWSFQRMNPEIRQIYKRNVISLSACEEMLASLASDEVDVPRFRKSLEKARSNITESGEKESLLKIGSLLKEFESGKKEARKRLAEEIVHVTHFNREAIIKAAVHAQKMRQAGAWGIVFMTLIFFGAALFFEQRLRKTLLLPLQEIALVMEARIKGDKFRRCHILHANTDMKKLFDAINSLLDHQK